MNDQDELQKQMEDSDIIFTVVSSANYASFAEASRAIVMFYVPDMSFSRGGISHALKRLEKNFSAD